MIPDLDSRYILHIETSGTACSVALSLDGNFVEERLSENNWSHSRELSLLIDTICKQNKIKPAEISAVAVSSGPGSYTGLRVGLSSAKAICYAAAIPLIAIPTLKIIASEYIGSMESDYCIATIDARRDEVYFQVYDRKLEEITEVDNLILDKNSFESYHKALVCGDGAQKASRILDQRPGLEFKPTLPYARNMCLLAWKAFCAKRFEDLAYFSPNYLKSPNITKSKKPLF